MSGAVVIGLYALRECVRRRVFAVVLLLTVVFLALYGAGTFFAFRELEQSLRLGTQDLIEERVVAGSTLFGLAMFSTLFLGAVLAVFLTLGAVRGDDERGLLAPLVVRPVGRTQFLLGRFGAAATVCAAYVAAVYTVAMVITGVIGEWWPDRIVGPGLGMVAGVIVIVAIALLGSVFLSATANGIAVFMIFGAGLTAGLLGQIGEALGSDTLTEISGIATWMLPFEALYQAGLHGLTADATGLTGTAVQLGPFGGAQEASALLWPWAVAYVAAVGLAARVGFARRDL